MHDTQVRKSWTPDEFAKSSFSPPHGGDCVEVAQRPGVAAVRDSKQSFDTGQIIEFSGSAWAAFTGKINSAV